MKKSRAAVLAAALLSALAVGCGSDPTVDSGAAPNPSSNGEFGTADVTFVQGMIPHHEQAVAMAEQVLESGADADVRALAERVKAAQAPEIEQMRAWLADWGVEESSSDEHAGHGSSSSDGSSTSAGAMAGMMSDDDLAQFRAATGLDLDLLFLELMIVHHEGAIAMAEVEIADGVNAAVVSLATSVASSQRAEIDEMLTLIDQLRSS